MSQNYIYTDFFFRFQTFDDYLWYVDKYYTGLANFKAAKNFEPTIEPVYLDVLRQDRMNVSYHVSMMRQEVTWD